MAFIDDMRSKCHAVESTCGVFTEYGCRVDARIYWAWETGRTLSARTLSDALVIDALFAPRSTPEGARAPSPGSSA